MMGWATHQVAVRFAFATTAFAFLMCLCVTLIVTGPTAHLTAVSPRDVQLFEASPLGLPRQAAAADRLYSLEEKRTLPDGGSLQYQISLRGTKVAAGEPLGIIVLGMGASGTLFFNAIGIGQSELQPAPTSSRGGNWLSVEVSNPIQKSGQARLDLILDEKDVWGIGIGGIKIGRLADVVRATQHEKGVQQTRLIVFAVVGLLGLGLSLFCFLARIFWAGISGLVFSCVLLAWCFSHALGFGTLAITALQMAYVCAAAAAVAASRAFSARLGGIWLGLGLFALIGGVTSVWGWRIGLSFDLVATVTEVAPVVLCAFGLPLCVGAMTAQLMKDRTQAQAEAARQAAIVEQKNQELERQADRQAVTEERKRFARDIHDGIGGQLVSLLWRVRAEPIPQEELAAEIEQGLADLRLVVDALDDGPVSLAIALANFAYRAREQLQAANIAFEWDLPRDFDVYWSDSRQILSLYRILQETVSNVMRHAKARNLAIRFAGPHPGLPDQLSVIIEDDGCGFEPEITPAGRGLANIRTRAAQIGGTVIVTSPILPKDVPTFGTRITIVLPSRNQIQLPA